MFKKKKEEKIKIQLPEPKIIKQWQYYRLVQFFYEPFHEEKSIKSRLILQSKNQNSMKEPYWIDSHYEGNNDFQIELMFKLFRETFLNE